MKKVRSSQAAIPVLNWVKQFFPVSIVNFVWPYAEVSFFYIVRTLAMSGSEIISCIYTEISCIYVEISCIYAETLKTYVKLKIC